MKESNTLSVPSQMYLLFPTCTSVWMPLASCQIRLLTPSEATMRSASVSCAAVVTSRENSIRAPACAIRYGPLLVCRASGETLYRYAA